MIDDTEKKGSKNMNESRDFKGVWIPKKVWLDTRLNALEKIILTEIDSLDNGEKGCYASNEHLAEFCQCSKTKVSTAIRKLIDCGYIYVQNFDGRKRELKSRLSNFERQNIKNCKAEYHNLKESNTDINTDNNTNNKLSKKERKSKPKSYDEQIAEYTQNEDLQNALKAFLQMRSFIKKPMTEYALKLMLKKLDELGNTDDTKIAILNQSITNNWQCIFPLKNEYTKQEKQPEKKYDQNGYGSEEELMAMFYGK
jgi:DNA-binding transcriptional regulator GbsR (MarR family)|nr:MAG TPA: helix-turn-helix domain protein [Caudoviricetes sp.]